MPREKKVFGTNACFGKDVCDVLIKHGYRGSHNQFRVICKATGIYNANTIFKKHGFSYDVFNKDYTSETGNKIELELAQIYPAWVCIDGTLGNDFIRLDELMEEAKRIK